MIPTRTERDPDTPLRVLLVEDEEITREWITALLIGVGHQTLAVADAASALASYKRFRPHVALLDLMLPDGDDFELTTRIAAYGRCGVIIVSSVRQSERRIDGLRSGADDYLTKPCNPDELLLKVRHLGDRVRASAARASDQSTLWLGAWTFDPQTRICTHANGHNAVLTDKESALLKIMLQGTETVFTRCALIDRMGSSGNIVSERAIDSLIARLRRKLEDNPARPRLLQSVYGSGYRVNV